MLGKLIKYEFRSTLRYYIPLYIALILVSLLSAALLHLPAQTPDALIFLSTSLYILLAIALAATTFVLTIARFYRNLLGQEGYLMFSLPVTADENILGKLIPAMSWCIGSVILGLLTVIPMLSINMDFSTMFTVDPELRFIFEKEVAALVILGITCIICGIMDVAGSILFFYLCMSIGQTFNEHKLLASVAAYLIIQTGMQILTTSLMFSMNGMNFMFRLDNWATALGEWFMEGPVAASLIISLCLLVFCVIWCAVPYFITRWLLTKKLNLA